MNNLLIDIGNSEIKIGTASAKDLNVNLIYRFSYSKNQLDADFSKHFSMLKHKTGFNNIGISVLNEKNIEWLRNYFIKKHKVKPVFINRNLKLPVKIDYSPELGNDRICSAAAASGIIKYKNILVVDFGTATTYTLISDKTIKSGIISPGIKTSLQSLIQRTSLPDVIPQFPENLFNINTVDNIKAGVLYSALYSCERIIIEAKKKYKDLYVIATGGYSNLIFGKTKLINKADENLVLKGINLIISK